MLATQDSYKLVIPETNHKNLDVLDSRFGSLQSSPTTPGQSLATPGHSTVGDESSTQGSGPLNG